MQIRSSISCLSDNQINSLFSCRFQQFSLQLQVFLTVSLKEVAVFFLQITVFLLRLQHWYDQFAIQGYFDSFTEHESMNQSKFEWQGGIVQEFSSPTSQISKLCEHNVHGVNGVKLQNCLSCIP